MRLDYFMIPREWTEEGDKNTPKLISSDILRKQLGSDHLPIEIVVEFPEEQTFLYAKNTKPKEEELTNIALRIEKLRNIETDPLAYRGLPGRIGRSRSVQKETPNTKEEMNSIVSEENTIPTLIEEFVDLFEKVSKEADEEERLNTIYKETEDEKREQEEKWIPHIKMRVQNYGYVSCMADTGANSNVVNLRFLQKILGEDCETHLRPTAVVLRVGDTSRTVVLGKVKISFSIEGRRFTETFLVMRESNFEILLGSSFHHKYRADIRYSLQIYEWKDGNGKHTFSTPISRKQIHNLDTEGHELHSMEDITLPPLTKTIIPTRLPKKFQHLYDQQFGKIERSEELTASKGCFVALGFGYMQERGRFNVEILNPSRTPVTIPKGTKVAMYVSTTENEYCEEGKGMKVDLTENEHTGDTEEVTNLDTEMQDVDTIGVDRKDVKKAKELDVGHIPKEDEIKDFMTEELDKLFSEAP